jgi:hypothetical protein
MAIGALEPLYRYLESKGNCDPITTIIKDIEILAKGKYVHNAGDGVVACNTSDKISGEIKQKLQEMQGPAPMAHHCMYQAIGKKMYMSISRISTFVSKTALSLCINEDDTINVDYLEYDAIFGQELVGKTLWNSISTVVVADDGTTKRGFLRAETRVYTSHDGERIGIKVDFKLSRSTPFYIVITNCTSATQIGIFGPAAKSAFLAMETAWTT